MSKALDSFVKNIKSLKLSPIEKIMLVYDSIKILDLNKISNRLGTNNDSITLTILFNECMSKLGYDNCFIKSKVNSEDYMHSIVSVEDDKYDIHGVYNFDLRADRLSKETPDNSISYAFFCRNLSEMNNIKENRIFSGIYSVIMNKDLLSAYKDSNPLDVINVVSGFYFDKEIEEDKNFIKKHCKEIEANVKYWPQINQKQETAICFIKDKVNYARKVPMNVLEEIIINVRKLKNKSLSNDKFNEKIEEIKEFNNAQFAKNFSDSRLLFDVKPKNYVNQERYLEVLKEIDSIYSGKKNDKLKTIIKFTNDQRQQVIFKVVSDKKILLDYTFAADYNFAEKFLGVLIQLYSDHFSYKSSEISKAEYFNLDIRSYICKSTDDSLFSIVDGRLKLIEKLDSYLKSSSNVVTNNNDFNNLKVKKKEYGFANAIVLAHVVGIALGIVFMAIYMTIK